MNPGDTADIYNTTLEGGVVLEGSATLIKRRSFGHAEPYENWEVQFDGDEETYDRLVHPDNVTARKEG